MLGWMYLAPLSVVLGTFLNRILIDVGYLILPNGDNHECEQHSVDHAQRRVDEAGNVVVSLARDGWHEALDQLEPYERDQATPPTTRTP